MRNMLLAIAAASLIAAPMAFAQTAESHHEHHQARESAVENRVDHHLSYLTTVLSLSNTQQLQAKTILTNAMNENQPLLNNIKTERRGLRAAVEKNEPPSTVKQFSDKIGNDVSQLAMNDATAGEQLYKILNADQQSKLTQLQNEDFGRFGMGWGAATM